jgi:putative toxin-antitoxin system antitoxin component (TIGR02293 family)
MTQILEKTPGKNEDVWGIASSSKCAIYEQVLAANLFGNQASKQAPASHADFFTYLHLHNAILKGLPAQSLARLSKGMSVPPIQLLEVVQIPKRTAARRKIFKADESDRIFRLAALFQKAVELFGNLDSARKWFVAPQRALGGKTPLGCAETSVGTREVEMLIGRLEHGVFT